MSLIEELNVKENLKVNLKEKNITDKAIMLFVKKRKKGILWQS